MTPQSIIPLVWLAWVISWVAAAVWSDRAIKRPRAGREVVYRLIVTAGTILLFGWYGRRTSTATTSWRPGPEAGWVLVGVAVAGFLFTWWARIVLGRLWSSTVTRKAHHHLVDTGPYAVVRHPIYTGLILAAFATAALRGNVEAGVGAAVMTLGWYIKARLEEEFLREQLGVDRYAAYARRVPMLVPFLRLPPERT